MKLINKMGKIEITIQQHDGLPKADTKICPIDFRGYMWASKRVIEGIKKVEDKLKPQASAEKEYKQQ